MGVITKWPNVFSRLEIAPGGSLIGWGGISGSQTFYVQGAGATLPGNDGNDGRSFNKPLATITAALGKCESMRNDVIYILNYWTAADETWPIAVNKKCVHIIGVAQPGLPFPAIAPSGTTAAFTIHEDGSYCEIAYLAINGGTAGAGVSLGPASSPNNKPEGVWIHDNVFGHNWFGACLSGIDSPEYGAVSARIERNTFLGDLCDVGGRISGNAIDLTTTSAFHEDLQIVDNTIMGCQFAISVFKGRAAVITGNKVVHPDSASGEAVYLQAGCVGCLVDDNHAMAGGDAAASNIPFEDDTQADNDWGQNTSGWAAAAGPTT